MINSLRFGTEAQGPEKRYIPCKIPKPVLYPKIKSQETMRFKPKDWDYALTEKNREEWIIKPIQGKDKRRTCTKSADTEYQELLIKSYNDRC